MIEKMRAALARWWASTTPRDAEAHFGGSETTRQAALARKVP